MLNVERKTRHVADFAVSLAHELPQFKHLDISSTISGPLCFSRIVKRVWLTRFNKGLLVVYGISNRNLNPMDTVNLTISNSCLIVSFEYSRLWESTAKLLIIFLQCFGREILVKCFEYLQHDQTKHAGSDHQFKEHYNITFRISNSQSTCPVAINIAVTIFAA